MKRMTIQEVGKGVAEEKQREREKLKIERENVKMQQEKTDRTSLDPNNKNADVDRTGERKIQEIKSRTGESKGERSEQKDRPQTSSSPRGKGDSPREGGGKSPTVPTLPGVPFTSYQLQADWKRLQSHPDILFEYFKVTIIVLVPFPPFNYDLFYMCYFNFTIL